MMHLKTGVALWLALVFVAPYAAAHEDQHAPLAKADNVYATPKPLGQLRVVYTAAKDAGDAGLSVECDLFRAAVPAAGLADLPRPAWDRFTVAYSLTNYEGGKWTDRPYVYVMVPLYGPAGQAWEQTWVTYNFDADGKPVRRIKRFIPDPAGKFIRSVWKEWEIGSGVSAEALLEAAKDE